MGFYHAAPGDMTRDEAQAHLDDLEDGHTYFDYLQGRVMKVDLGGDSLRVDLYDRDNGPGAAQAALAEILVS